MVSADGGAMAMIESCVVSAYPKWDGANGGCGYCCQATGVSWSCEREGVDYLYWLLGH